MSMFITLQMYKDQDSGNRGSISASSFKALTPPAKPFTDWRTGYYVKSQNTASTTQWKIDSIQSKDGKMHNDDCTVTLRNDADEVRMMKGSSLRFGYEFVSTGDVPPDPVPVDAPVKQPMRDDCQAMTVNIAGIREYYQRNRGEGSRVLMLDKTTYIVADTPEQIGLMIKAVGGTVL